MGESTKNWVVDMKKKQDKMSEKEALKFLEGNAKFIQKEAKHLKSYYFHRRNEWLFYIPLYQIAYLWKVILWGYKSNESIKRIAELNISFEKYHKLRVN